jgi:acetyltransferase
LTRRAAFVWPREARTSDGIQYRIRPISTADATREREFIAGLSTESRYRRFMHALGEASPAFIAQLVNIDRHLTMALIAVTGDATDERIIGVARYAADQGGVDCEFAVAIGDEWQSRGIGTALMRLLFDYAAREGFRMIYGNVQPDNERMIALARNLDLEVEPPRPRQQMVRVSRLLN